MQDRGSLQRARSWESLERGCDVGGVCTGWTQFLLMVPAERELLLLVVGRLTPSLPTILVTAPLVHWQFSLLDWWDVIQSRREVSLEGNAAVQFSLKQSCPRDRMRCYHMTTLYPFTVQRGAKKFSPCLKFLPHFCQAKWPARAQPIGPDGTCVTKLSSINFARPCI